MNDQELEVKYYVKDLPSIEQRLVDLEARLVHPRINEINLRFDTQDLKMSRRGQVLRLRHDSLSRLTYKGASRSEEGVRAREEIEFTVGDFQAARKLLTALGFHVLMIYEKFRTTYDWKESHITLDEMPYGNFVEIEGPNPTVIQHVNQDLGLEWDARIFESYTVLFDHLREKLELTFRDLIFENFEGIVITPETLNVRPADGLVEA